jgi:TonB family protein
MTYIQSKIKSLAVLAVAAAFFAACNSNNSSSKLADSTATADTSQMTGAVQPSAPEQTTSKATEAPATSQPANTTTPVVVNKKVEVIVEPVPVVQQPPNVRMDNAGVYEYPEVGPQYPGGNYAIENYINNHIRYPRPNLHNNIQGRTNVSFIVNENGKITDAHIVGRKLGYGLDEEAVRIVSSMPYWKPGTVRGRAVKSRITLPITFKVQA